MIPDGVDGAPDGRDVLGMGEDRIFLFGNADAAEFARQVGKIGHFDAGDVIEVSGIVTVAADAIGHLPDPVGNRFDLLVKALPLVGNAGALVLMGAAFADAGDQQGLAGFETRRLKFVGEGLSP